MPRAAIVVLLSMGIVVSATRRCAAAEGADVQPPTDGSSSSGVRSATGAAAIQQALSAKTTAGIEATPLNQAIEALAKAHGLSIQWDQVALDEEAIQIDEQVTLPISDITLRSALNLLLEPMQLTWVIRDEILQVTTLTKARELLDTRVYAVHNLLPGVGQAEAERALIKLITSSVEPDNWDEVGGSASIRVIRQNLVVRQTAAAHDEITRILADVGRIVNTPTGSALPAVTADLRIASESVIASKLAEMGSLNCEIQPLDEALDSFAKGYGLPLWIDRTALLYEGLDSSSPISAKLNDVRLQSLLNFILRPLELTWIIEDEVLKITTVSKAGTKLATRVYDVRDLVTTAAAPLTWPPAPDALGGMMPPFGGGIPFLGLMGGGLPNMFADDSRTVSPGESVLLETLQSTIEPESWDEMGGAGSVRAFRGALAVRQTQKIHSQVEVVLANIRAMGRASAAAPASVLDEFTQTLKVYRTGTFPADELAKLIPEVVAAHTWTQNGGEGAIYSVPGAIVVRQDSEGHQAVIKLMHELPIIQHLQPVFDMSGAGGASPGQLGPAAASAASKSSAGKP